MLLGGEEHYRCPRLPLFEQPNEFGYWLALYRDYKKGVMPEAGGRLDQSAYVLEMLGIMEHTYAQVEEHLMAEAEKKGSRKSGQRSGVMKG